VKNIIEGDHLYILERAVNLECYPAEYHLAYTSNQDENSPYFVSYYKENAESIMLVSWLNCMTLIYLV